MSIKELLTKIKGSQDIIKPEKDWDALIFSGIMVLVAFASFGLGRLSIADEANVPVIIEGRDQSAGVIGSTESSVGGKEQGGLVVASRNSTKYHFPWCSGALRISDKNKVWFSSIEEARVQGYAPASNCKGLE